MVIKMKTRLFTLPVIFFLFFSTNLSFDGGMKCKVNSENFNTSQKRNQTSQMFVAQFGQFSDHSLVYGFLSTAHAKPLKSSSPSSKDNSKDENLIASFPGHEASVSTIAFSHNGKLLASGGWDNAVKVWDIDKKKIIFDLKKHTGGVTSIDFHPKNLFLASTSLDSSIRVWGIKKEEVLSQSNNEVLQGDIFVSTTAKSESSKSANYTIFPALTISKAHENWINIITYSPNGRYLASGGWDNLVKIWDAQTGNLVKTFKGHKSAILDIYFTKDSKTLITSSKDETIKFWDIARGNLKKEITGHSGWIMSIGLNSDESILASGGSDETISLWDVASKPDTALEIKRFLGHKDYVRSLDFSNDGKILVSGGDDNKVKFWNIASGKEILEIEGHTSWVRTVKYSPNVKVVASAGDDQMINLWKADKAVELMNKNAEVVKAKTVSKAKKIAYRRRALIKRKCNRCHTYRAVEDKITTRNITSMVKRMQEYPNSGLTNGDVREIIRYLKSTIKRRY